MNNFDFFASSHLYLGVELAAGLTIMGIFSEAGQYLGRTWSLWLASLSFLSSPFWFNPLTFDWNVVASDYSTFLDWMGGSSGGPIKSWSMWWIDENSHYKKMVFSSKIVYIMKSALYLLVANGIRMSDLLKANTTLNKPWVSIGRVISLIGGLLLVSALYRSNSILLPYALRRTTGIICTVGLLVGVLVLFLEDSDFIRFSMAAYYGVGAFCQLGLLVGIKFVKHFYFIHDMVCGHIIFFSLFILGALQFMHYIQTWLLYHNALSSDVVVSNILRYARKNQEAGSEGDDDLAEQVAELRKTVQRQEELLFNAGVTNVRPGMGARTSSTDAISELVDSGDDSTLEMKVTPTPAPAPRSRMHQSMTAMDVWGSMAIGDMSAAERTNILEVGREQARTAAPTKSDFEFASPDIMPPR